MAEVTRYEDEGVTITTQPIPDDEEPQNARRRIPLMRFVPDEKVVQSYKDNAPSKEEIKEVRKGLVAMCSRCNAEKKPEKVRFCSGCKTSRYCSTKCQRDDWPSHRAYCKSRQASGKVPHRDLVTRLAERVIANSEVMWALEVHVILLLELHKDLSNSLRYVARIECTTILADIAGYLERMVNGDGERDPNAEVRLSIKKGVKVKVEDAPEVVQNQFRALQTKRTREGVMDPGLLMYFVNQEDPVGVVLYGSVVAKEQVYYVRERLKTPEGKDDFKNSLQHAEATIYMDKENKFKLRTRSNDES